MTSVEILGVVAEQWPGGIDLDPCHDPESLVHARQTYDVRAGRDGLVLPWVGRVWMNPPYSTPTAWLARAAQHGATAGGEVLSIVNAATGTRAWRASVWPHASVCFLHTRPKFRAAGSTRWTENTKDSAVLFWSVDAEQHRAFGTLWSEHGHCVGPAWLRYCALGADVSREL